MTALPLHAATMAITQAPDGPAGAADPARDADIALDAGLMARIARGDDRAFRAVIDAHSAPVIGLARRMTGDAALAEDIAQEAFLRLWRTAETWRPEARLAAWLKRVAVNLCIDHGRKPATEGLALVEDRPDPSPLPEHQASSRQTAAAVRAALDALPDRQRQALVLTQFEGYSTAEVAEALQTSGRSVESLVFRARRTLAQTLAPLMAPEAR